MLELRKGRRRRSTINLNPSLLLIQNWPKSPTHPWWSKGRVGRTFRISGDTVQRLRAVVRGAGVVPRQGAAASSPQSRRLRAPRWYRPQRQPPTNSTCLPSLLATQSELACPAAGGERNPAHWSAEHPRTCIPDFRIRCGVANDEGVSPQQNTPPSA